jgi:uncharacterized protein YqcC (DUF446 family)
LTSCLPLFPQQWFQWVMWPQMSTYVVECTQVNNFAERYEIDAFYAYQ